MKTGTDIGRLRGVTMLQLGTHELILSHGGTVPTWFLPQFCFAALRSLSGGAVTTTAQFRIGGNANHDNVAPAFTVPGAAAVGDVVMLPLASPFAPVNLRTQSISVEVTRAGIGPSTMTADFLLVGLVVD